MAEKIIDIKHLQKHFGDLQVLNDVDFNVDKGEVVTVIGSSGSGKSTLLRCINLLEIPDGGEIVFEGQDIRSLGNKVSKYRAKVSMVFQSFNLFESGKQSKQVPGKGLHGVPELQSVQQHECAGQLHDRAGEGPGPG